MAVVNSNNFFGLQMNKNAKQMFIRKFVQQAPNLEGRIEAARFYTTDTTKNYVISNPALETITNIKLDNPYKILPLILNNLHDGEATILLKNKSFYRYMKVDNNIICIYMRKRPTTKHDFYIDYEGFRLEEDSITHTGRHQYPEPVDETIKLFIKLIVFLKCTNVVEVHEMLPNQKARISNGNDRKWINKTGVNVTLVNSDWNKIFIRTQGFAVNGHLRFQRHGKENKLVKLIWIDSYNKQGYSFHRK